jgi:hypothetical protein
LQYFFIVFGEMIWWLKYFDRHFLIYNAIGWQPLFKTWPYLIIS